MFLKDTSTTRTFELAATGSIFKGIRIAVLNDASIIVPDENTLTLCSRQLKAIIVKQNALSDEINSLIELRDWLLPMLMNGQVSVE